MTDERNDPTQASDDTFGPAGQQPGVTDADLGEDAPRARPEDLEITDVRDVADPPIAGEEPHPRINADLLDDPEDVVRTIEEATGERVEVVHEEDTTD